MRLSTILILMACNVVWALNVVVSKLVVTDLDVPPLFYALARSLVAVVFLFPLLLKIPQKLVQVLLVGLAIGGGSFALFFMGLKTATPSAAGIVNLSSAPMTVLFAILFLGEKIKWKRALGIVLTLVGVGIAMGSPSAMGSIVGLLLVFAAAVIGALGSVFFKRLEIGALDMQAWAGLASAIVLVPASLATETSQIGSILAAPWEFAAALFFAGVIVSIGAHTAYYKILQDEDANLVVPLTLLTPLLTIAMGATITGDEIGWPMIFGSLLAMVGVAIIVLRPSATMFKPTILRPRL